MAKEGYQSIAVECLSDNLPEGAQQGHSKVVLGDFRFCTAFPVCPVDRSAIAVYEFEPRPAKFGLARKRSDFLLTLLPKPLLFRSASTFLLFGIVGHVASTATIHKEDDRGATAVERLSAGRPSPANQI